MATERVTPSTENLAKTAELEAARSEKLSELESASSTPEAVEHSEKRAEKARAVIERQDPEPDKTEEAALPPVNQAIPLLSHHLNYAQTLASVQRKLKPASRNFSKVIHTPIVEKTSEVLETTVARPSVLLGTTWTALIVGTAFYLTARHYGYSLSGSELLFSFIVGALLGLLLEGLWRVLKRR